MRTLTAICCAVALVALYGCGGSGFISEFPGESGEVVTPTEVHIQGGVAGPSSPVVPSLGKDANYWTGDSLTAGLDASGDCADIAYDLDASVSRIEIVPIYEATPGSTPELVNIDLGESCANEAHCLEYAIVEIETGDVQVYVDGQLLCDYGDQFELEIDFLVVNPIVTNQATDYGATLIKFEEVDSDSDVELHLDGDWIGRTFEDPDGNETCVVTDTSEGVLGIDIDWMNDAWDAAGLIDQDVDQGFMDSYQTDARYPSRLDGSNACTISYTIPVVVDFDNCIGQTLFDRSATIEASGMACLNESVTDCDAGDHAF